MFDTKEVDRLLSKLCGKSERVELVKTSAMDKLRTGFLGEKSAKNNFKENDMATSKMNEILVNLRHAIGEETIAAMTGPIATPLAQKKIERTFPKDDLKGIKPVGSPAPQAGGDPRNYGKEAVKSAYPHGIKTEEKLGGGGDAFKSAPKAVSTVKDPGLGKKEAPEGKAVMGSSPKQQAGGDAKHYGDEKAAPKADLKDTQGGAPKSTSEVKTQKLPSVDVKGKSIVGAPKEAKVDSKVKAYDDEKKVKDLGKGGKLAEDDLPLGAPKTAPVQTAAMATTGAPAATALPPAEPNPEEVKYREIHISDELIPEVAAKVRELVQGVLPDAVPSVVLKFQANMLAAEAGRAALEAAGVKVTEID